MAPPRTTLLYRVTFPFLKAAIWLVMSLLARLRFEGIENVPKSGGVLITPNHLSDCDPFAVTVGLRRRAWHMGKAELFEMPVVGAFCRFCQTFAVKRGHPDREALRMAEALLRAGEAVMVFPEGRLSETGLLQPMYSGVALLALRTGVPVVPVGITGTDSVLSYGETTPHRSQKPVTVRYGRPLDLTHLTSLPTRREQVNQAMDLIGQEIARLSGQPYVPGGKPDLGE